MNKEKTMQEAAKELQEAIEKLKHEIAKALRIYALLDWITSSRRNRIIFTAVTICFYVWFLYLHIKELILR